MMRSSRRFPTRLIARARRDRSGMAATEFALILPVMTLLFFGMLEASDAMMANRRVAHAANSLADLVGQEAEITPSQITSIFTGVERMLAPNSGSSLTMALSSVRRDPNNQNNIIVDWSRDQDGNEAYAPDSSFTKLDDDTILHDGISLIVAELRYEHNSGLTDNVFGNPIVFNKMTTRWPRKSTRVVLCLDNPGDPENPNCPS